MRVFSPATLLGFTLIFLSGLAQQATALDYDLKQPPSVIVDHRQYEISVSSDEPVTVGQLPSHPKIFWLSKTETFEKSGINSEVYVVTMHFMALATGIIEFPALPIKVANQSLLVRLDQVSVNPNRIPKSASRMHLYWDGSETQPENLYVGQTVELTFQQIIERRGSSTEPVRKIEGVDWHVYTRRRGQRSRDRDYLRPSPSQRSIFGGPSDSRVIRTDRLTENGKHYLSHRFRGRFTVGSTNQLSGHCYFTSIFPRGERIAIVPISIPVKPVPPLKDETAIDTGLVGDWSIEGRIAPAQLAVQQPFRIALGIVGRGNPSLLRDFDFARPGFSSIELSSEHLNKENRLTSRQRISVQQELLPSGEVPVFPALKLASFDPSAGQWVTHQITEAITLTGLSETAAKSTRLVPASENGRFIQRPIFLNLPAITFPMIALAPLLPLLAGLLRKRLDQKDPELDARREKFQQLLSELRSDDASNELIDDEVLPTLRNHLNLPTGATAREISQDLKTEHPELAELLIEHSNSAFSTEKSSIDFSEMARHLAKISFLCLLFITPLRGVTLEEANKAFEEKRYRAAATLYQELIREAPGYPELHLNLAKARLNADQTAPARAACHTALLLDPLNSEGRELMNQILSRLGQPTLPGTHLLALRPDQFLFLAAFLWLICFILLALRRFKKIPAWPAWICLTTSLILLTVSFWRKQQAYASDQYMVLAEELPREPTPGTPDWNFPALRSGQLIRISQKTATHAEVLTSETSFWLPLKDLQQVW